MITEEMIARINELARKSKESGLDEEEKAEQAGLRRAYIDAFKTNLRAQLDNIRIVDSPSDNGIKPEGVIEEIIEIDKFKS
jgi:5-formyltetrahydrofolate cyclo-ligase